jgi:hypothetical protein
MDNTLRRIAGRLHEAAETHHRAYRITDGDDPDWASCYPTGRAGRPAGPRFPRRWPGPGRPAHRRVIGIGGERLSCCDVQERVYLNESPLDEPYIAENAPLDVLDEGCRPRRFAPVAVALGELFVMGDHRATAEDSRCLGTVPVSAVVAVVEAPNPG